MRLLISLVATMAASPAATAAAWLFDMGSANSPVAEGYRRVTHETVYTAQQGYGWTRRAEASFDDPIPVKREFQGTHPHYIGPVQNDVLRDGVEEAEPLVFVVDVPPGRYWVSATVGRYTKARHDLNVAINGNLVATNVDAWGHVWGSHGGTPTRTIAAVASPTNGQLRIEFTATPIGPERWREYSHKRPQDGKLWFLGENKNSVLGIRVLPWVESPAKLAEIDERVEQALEADRLLGSMELQDRKREIELAGDSMEAWRAISAGEDEGRKALAAVRFESAQRYRLALEYIDMLAYSWANKKTGLNNYHRYWAAYDLCTPFVPEDPLYVKSHLLRGRVAMWNGHEGHWKNCYELAVGHFAVLKASHPDHPLVKIYTGGRVPAPKAYVVAAMNAPEWARLQHEALNRYLDVVHYWVRHRQAENGELGGNWGDDVEILRGWAPAVLAVQDQVALDGIRKLAEGVWHSEEVENGFSRKIGDVEHAAELVTDTQPLMCAVDYGDPVYLERCMATMRCFRDVWTRPNARGHRHFKAHFFSATAVSTNAPHTADVALNGRAANPGIWLLWYNKHPEVVRLLGEWCQAWIDDAGREENGKPKGFVPASVRFEDDRIGGFSERWWETKGYFSDFEAMGYTATLYHQMFALRAATEGEKWMDVLRWTWEAIQREAAAPSQNAPQGSAAWAARVSDSEEVADVFAKYRQQTGSRVYDSFLARRGTAYVRYLISGNTDDLCGALRKVIDGLSYNVELSTSEVLFTDRVNMPGSGILFEMMTGSAGEPNYYPMHAVTWGETENKLAVLVEHATAVELKGRLYWFGETGREIACRLWRLEPGEYEFARAASGRNLVERIRITERGQAVQFKVPPQQLMGLEFRQVAKGSPGFEARADLALGGDAVELAGDAKVGRETKLKVRVHNVGRAAARPVRVVASAGGVLSKSVILPELDWPKDLSPRIHELELSWTPVRAGREVVTVRVDAEDSVPEISEQNNTSRVEISVRE